MGHPHPKSPTPPKEGGMGHPGIPLPSSAMTADASVSDLHRVTVHVCRHWRSGVGRRKAAHDGVDRAASISDHKHQLNDSAAGAVGRDWEINLRITGAIRINGIAPVLHVVEPILIGWATNYQAVGHHEVHLLQPAVPVEGSHR